jgi:hypothetical protein
MSAEILQRSEAIFQLIRNGQLSSDEGALLLTKLYTTSETKDVHSSPITKSPSRNPSISRMIPSQMQGCDDNDDETFHDAYGVQGSSEKLIQYDKYGRMSPVPPTLTRIENDVSVQEEIQSTVENVDADTDVRKDLKSMQAKLEEHSYFLKRIGKHLLGEQVFDELFSKQQGIELSSDKKSIPTVTASASMKEIPFKLDDSFILSVQNPHPCDNKISTKSESGNFTVEVEMESSASVIRSYCKQFNADEAIISLRQSPNWGPNSKYFKLSDEEIKLLW